MNAYLDALEIQDDPVVKGLVGLLLAQSGDPTVEVDAARYLYVAVSRAAGRTHTERQLFWGAYEKLRRRVCRVDIETSDVDAVIDIGDDVRPIRSAGMFWAFVGAGRHTFRGTLKGHADLVKEIECIRGVDMYERFDFEKLPEPDPELRTKIQERLRIIREKAPSPSPKPSLVPTKPTDRQRYGFVTGAIGPTVVWGASPSPALGAGMSITYRYRNVSGVLTGRGAWAVGDVAKAPIDVFVFNALGGPCAHWDWFTACALASLNAFQHEIHANRWYKPATNGSLIPGAGLGVAGQYHLWRSLGLRLSADVTVLAREMSIADKTKATIWPLWDGGRIFVGASLALTFDK